MQLEKASYIILKQNEGENGVYEMAEYAGRICLRSMENKKIYKDSKAFVENILMAKEHGAPLEHGTIYLKIDNGEKNKFYCRYNNNPYSKVKYAYEGDKKILFITTNLRVLFENGWMDDLEYLSPYCKQHERRISVQFYLDRFTGEEFLRHRHDSFCRESTRFVNFLMDKFGGGNISFILPPWMGDETECLTDREYEEMCIEFGKRCTLFYKLKKILGLAKDKRFSDREMWLFSLRTCEMVYNKLIGEYKWQPQQARTVLPCAIKSPLLVTAFESDWIHFFNLRSDIGKTGKPHPQAEELATPLREEFIKRGYIRRSKLYKPENNIKGINLKDSQ